MRSFGAFALVLGIALASPRAHGAPSSTPPTVDGKPAPTAADKETARRLFAEGSELEKQGRFTEALETYERASKIAETAGLRFHVAYCLEMNGKLASALRAYEAADALAVETDKPDVRAAVAARLEPLKLRVGHVILRLDASAKNAVLSFDGAPLSDEERRRGTVDVDPGLHTVTAEAEGFQPFTRTEKISEGQTKVVDVVLAPTAKARATALVEPPREPEKKRSYAGPLLATAGTLVLAGVGAGAFVMAGDAEDDARKSCPSRSSCDDERTNVRTLDTVALAGFSSAAVLGIASIVLWIRSGSTDTTKDGQRARTQIVASPTSVGLQGVF